MKIVSAAFGTLLAIVLFLSCNKEKSFELAGPATGTLQDDAGDCLPKTAVGAFIAGTKLTDSNYLVIQVDVTTVGSYNIHTDTANGYFFSGIGNFDHTGVNDIHLVASGTPTTSKTDEIVITFGTSSCFVHVTVLPAGSTGGPATFTLQGGLNDSCLSYAVLGNYVQNTPLTAANQVTLKINATTPGTWSITTSKLNGFQFSGAGTIAALGEQTITLTGSGTPAAVQATAFPVSANSTNCNFSVNVTGSTGQPPVGNTDHFPLTDSSYWTYQDDPANPEDSVIITNRGKVPVAGNQYSFFEYSDGSGTAYDTVYYRRNGNDYYSYVPTDMYTNLAFDTEVVGDVLFLKEGLAANQTWMSAEFSGTVSNVPTKLRYQFTCTEVVPSLTLNGTTYTNVYKVVAKPQVSAAGAAFAETGETLETWYAAGVGLIYEKGTASGITELETKIQHWVVK